MGSGVAFNYHVLLLVKLVLKMSFHRFRCDSWTIITKPFPSVYQIKIWLEYSAKAKNPYLHDQVPHILTLERKEGIIQLAL